MEAQIPSRETGIEDVYTRRGQHYPTRSDSIINAQDRQDWIVVARDIMTNHGRKPQAVSIISNAGSRRVELLRSFQAKKPQRSLWNILIGIFNSAQNTKTMMPTVLEMDLLFEELDPPKPSPALEQYRAQHPDVGELKAGIVPKKHLLDAPVIAHTSRRTRGLLAHSEKQDNAVATYYPQLTPKCQEVFRMFYGYVGIGDPANPASYTAPRKTLPMIAGELGLSYQTVYARFQKIAEIVSSGKEEQENDDKGENIETIISASQEKVETILKTSTRNNLSILPDVTFVEELPPTQKADFLAFYGYKGMPHDPTKTESYDSSLSQTREEIAEQRGSNRLAVQMSIYTAYRKLQELTTAMTPKDAPIERTTVTSEVQLPSFLKNRREVTPLPKKQSSIVPKYAGETKPTQTIPTRVVRPPQPVPTKFSPPPTSKKHIPVVPGQAPKKIGEPVFSFDELVEDSPDVRIIPRNPEKPSAPVVQKKAREIPVFTSYREAIEWGQQQTDWIWSITLWKNSTPPIQRDSLGVLTYLRISRNTELQQFLDVVRIVSGDSQMKYVKIFDALCVPLPEEKPSITDIQKNIGWMNLIEDAFQKHESGDHAGFMTSLATILADEDLASKVFDLMPEYEADDYVDILALVAGKNWTKKDMIPYQARTLKEMIGYKPGKYARLDAIIAKGSHVGKKMLKELSDIVLRVPLGQTAWPQFQEKNLPEVSLYDVIVSLLKEEEKDSTKALFYKLEDILGLKKE